MTYKVVVSYVGEASFIVEANNDEEAKKGAEQLFNSGQMNILGRSVQFEEVLSVEKI